MDLDNEELEATRKLHGLDKTNGSDINVGSIEENIKILEVENYYLEELGYLRKNNHFIKFNQALKNLIKAYKELEEENQQIEAIKDEAIRRYNFESIPVSLVEEMIEELDKQYEFYNSDKRKTKNIAKGYYIAIQKLQELLEKRK